MKKSHFSLMILTALISILFLCSDYAVEFIPLEINKLLIRSFIIFLVFIIIDFVLQKKVDIKQQHELLRLSLLQQKMSSDIDQIDTLKKTDMPSQYVLNSMSHFQQKIKCHKILIKQNQLLLRASIKNS